MRQQKPYACFGHVFLANILDAGDTFEIKKPKESIDPLFLVKGHIQFFDKATNEFVEEAYPGHFVSEYSDQHYRVEVIEPSVAFCFSGKLNQNYVPPLEPVIMESGDERVLPAQTKFFLCEGTVAVNAKEMTGPCQIMIQGEQTIQASTNLYGVIVG
jgi:hypothetical protein